MQESSPFFAQDFYNKHLSTINKIDFTTREINVIACLVNAKGAKKTAEFLGIQPSSVHSHLLKIRSKLECHSSAAIVTFIEKSGNLPSIRQYFYLLQSRIIFEKSLKDIAKINPEKRNCCLYIQEKDKDSFLMHLKSDLNLAGFSAAITRNEKKADYTLFVLPRLLTEMPLSSFLPKLMKSKNKLLLLLREKKNSREIPQELKKWKIIDFTKPENYFCSFFLMLEKLMPHLNLRTIITEFTDKYKKIQANYKLPLASTDVKFPESPPIYKKLIFPILACLSLVVAGNGFSIFYWVQKNYDKISIRSDLIIPNESAFLNRPKLITQIDNAFKNKKGIQTVALVGIGGSGKTTLARQYAHQQKTNVIWEINAETNANLIESFENLANALATTEEDKEVLHSILLEIKNSSEQEKKLVEFVKQRLRLNSKWFLIYDNIENFTDIQKYFPQDSETWGHGKIVLTTRNYNAANNKHVGQVISIGALTSDQKLNLFKEIITNGNTNKWTEAHTTEAKNFLEKIPPFPLDVSIAAYYLKATNISFENYLENLSNFDKNFIIVQENILKEIGEYTKTRHNIISTSLENIMSKKEEFCDLFLLISLIDSQNISRELLSNFKNKEIVDDFIFNLKKYSLITSDSSLTNFPNLDFSIHRSTQELIRSYFINRLNLENNKEKMKFITNNIENYIKKIIKTENVKKMNAFIPHCEFFLTHKKLINSDIDGTIKGLLGVIYYFEGDNRKAKKFLQESIVKLNKNFEKNSLRIAYIIGYLGNVFRDLGNYHKGVYFLRKSLSIYKKNYPKDVLRYGYFLVYLGSLERILGNHGIAKELFKQGLELQKKHFSENENYQAWVLGHLGILDREGGDYEKAKVSLEKSLESFKNGRSDDHFDIAWALEHLGPTYTKLENYRKAKHTLEQSIKIYSLALPDQMGRSWVLIHLENNVENSKASFKKVIEKYNTHFHENYIYLAYPLSHLGNLYIKLENYERAKLILKQCLFIYQKNYGNQHLAVAQVLNDLGRAYFLGGDLETGKNLIESALKIFKQEKHSNAYLALENLSEIFIKKHIMFKNKKEEQQIKNFKLQAIKHLKQALDVVKVNFPSDSPHIVRLQSKLTKLDQGNF